MYLRYLQAETATWEEARAYLARVPAAILPLGATEQHGPHLPQNTDTVLATEICRRVAERTAGYLLPALPITYSWVWHRFPGTAWVGVRTFMDVVKEIVRSLERGGVRAMLILTGHGANQGPLKYAVRELAEVSSVAILHGAPLGLDRAVQEAESRPWLGAYELHAEEVETSLMLAVRPDLVRMERAVSDYPPVPPDYGYTATGMGDLARTGVFGDATRATAAKGERWLAQIVEAVAGQWSAFLRQHGISLEDT
ncbi:MAG: creatininase family protein [Armatimonadota bacterium]|nr:creatininase family protein [Armatimonadota bacterium]MDR7469148.1 creatininase family protein [Armatimonadota bacterium]